MRRRNTFLRVIILQYRIEGELMNTSKNKLCALAALVLIMQLADTSSVVGQLGLDKDTVLENGPETPVDLTDKSPHQVYDVFCKAMQKNKHQQAVACLSKKGLESLIRTSIRSRQIVEKLDKGPFPESLSKSETEKLKKWSTELGGHYDEFDVGIDVNSSMSETRLLRLEDKKQRKYVESFLRIYTAKTAPKAFRDRMKTLWYTGRLKARKRIIEKEETASIEAASKKKSSISFSKIDDVWMLDGAIE